MTIHFTLGPPGGNGTPRSSAHSIARVCTRAMRPAKSSKNEDSDGNPIENAPFGPSKPSREPVSVSRELMSAVVPSASATGVDHSRKYTLAMPRDAKSS
jgi:hypothetical protein